VKKTIGAIVLVALLATGCGAEGTATTTETGPRYSANELAAYNAAAEVCAHDGPKRILRQLGYRPVDNKPVAADLYAQEVSVDRFYDPSYEGCLDGFREGGW
jgi:hypothetical protein